jgi:hypothetical protein
MTKEDEELLNLLAASPAYVGEPKDKLSKQEEFLLGLFSEDEIKDLRKRGMIPTLISNLRWCAFNKYVLNTHHDDEDD